MTKLQGPTFEYFRESRIALHQELIQYHREFFDVTVSELTSNNEELTYTNFLAYIAAAFNIELDGAYDSTSLGKLEEGLLHLLIKKRGVEVI